MNNQKSLGMGLIALTFLFSAEGAFAFGKKKPAEQAPVNQGIQAIPFRYANLAHITVPSFFLPNGTRADFNTDLDKILETAINSSRYVRTQENIGITPGRLVITGGITSLELDVLQLNLKIGWNRNGAIPVGTLPGAQGEVDLRLSSLSLDFKIYDRYTGQTYLASYTNETLSNLKMSVKVNFSELVGSLDILYKTKLAETIRQATLDVITNMENSQNFHLLPWQAKILGVDHANNLVVFNAGMTVGVKKNEIYSIYSGCDAREQNTTEGCFERFIADVKVGNASLNNAEASPFTTNDSIEKVWPGDTVYVKPLLQISN